MTKGGAQGIHRRVPHIDLEAFEETDIYAVRLPTSTQGNRFPRVYPLVLCFRLHRRSLMIVLETTLRNHVRWEQPVGNTSDVEPKRSSSAARREETHAV